jgi:hypothetical protein
MMLGHRQTDGFLLHTNYYVFYFVKYTKKRATERQYQSVGFKHKGIVI